MKSCQVRWYTDLASLDSIALVHMIDGVPVMLDTWMSAKGYKNVSVFDCAIILPFNQSLAFVAATFCVIILPFILLSTQTQWSC